MTTNNTLVQKHFELEHRNERDCVSESDLSPRPRDNIITPIPYNVSNQHKQNTTKIIKKTTAQTVPISSIQSPYHSMLNSLSKHSENGDKQYDWSDSVSLKSIKETLVEIRGTKQSQSDTFPVNFTVNHQPNTNTNGPA